MCLLSLPQNSTSNLHNKDAQYQDVLMARLVIDYNVHLDTNLPKYVPIVFDVSVIHVNIGDYYWRI